MSHLKIGIVEDELLIGRSIKNALSTLGYACTEICISYTEALTMIETEHPDLLLLDINLSGKKDGIEVAEWLNKEHSIPFIFLTANSDASTIERAKTVNPHAYLIKPFTREELYASIEIACHNFQSRPAIAAEAGASSISNQVLFVREHHSFQKVVLNEILFLESEENYVKLHLMNSKRVIIRSTFTDFLKQLPQATFFRTGRSYAIHLDHISKIDPTEIHIAGHRVPLSKQNRDELYQRLGIRKA